MPSSTRKIHLAASLAALLAPVAGACTEDTAARDAACARLDQVWTLERLPAGPAAAALPAARDLSTAKLAVAVYHFNIQYVVGGLRGFPDGTITPKYDLDEIAVEDRIVRQGLEPVLDLYLAHPELGADIELQAYTVEVIALRHPDVLDKMRTLANRGQIDFDSFHYSDQLWVAYPEADMRRSLELTKQVFDRVGLRLGRAIFTQEGQFATGQLRIAKELGYEVSVLPKNLFSYQYAETSSKAAPLFEDPSAPGHAVILGGRGFHQGGVDLDWTFMDDGEIAFTEGELNPYFGTDYVADPKRIADHLTELQGMIAAGYVHATIADAVRAARQRGISPVALPRVFDGTWQPKNTNNLFRWMGGAGLFRTTEADSDVLAANWRARSAAAALEAEAAASPDPRLARAVTATWREALFAEVSDSTGWNPFRTEIAYSFAHAASAVAIADDAHLCLGRDQSAGVAAPTCGTAAAKTLGDLGVEVVSEARVLDTTLAGCTAPAGASALYAITVGVPKLADTEPNLDDTDMASKERSIELRFAKAGADVELAPAFSDETVRYTLADYSFDSIGVALPLGLASLGDGRWVIQDLATQRTAAIVTRAGDDAGVLRFRDDTVSRAAASTRRWYLLEGADAPTAVAAAKAINLPSAR